MQKSNVGITVLDPKGDLAEKVWSMGKYFGKEVIYFNPVMPDCPYFNVLFGKEEEVIENMCTTFKMLSPDSSQFFLDQNDNLLRNALKVLKRLEAAEPTKYHANLIVLNRFLQNVNDEGRQMVIAFSRLTGSEEFVKENSDIASFFINDYLTGASGGRGATKTYEHTSAVRTQISKLISNKFLRKVLNPPLGRNDIDFSKHLAEGGIIAMSTAQGDLRDLAKTLGLFLILQFQSAVFRRPAPESSRKPHMFYIDEFQEFANPSMGILLTQGRSYRTGCLLATQARNQIALGSDGEAFLSLVSANARSLIVYPGIEANDAEYYSRQFGDIEKMEEREIKTVKPFDPFSGNFGFSRDVTKRIEKVTETRFSPSQIRFREFKEISYCIVKNNTLQAPGVGKIEFIPKDVNDKLDEMIEEFRAENMRKLEEMENKTNSKNIENNGKTMYDDRGTKMSNNVEGNSENMDVDFIDGIFDESDEMSVDKDMKETLNKLDVEENISVEDLVVDESGIDIYESDIDDDLF